MAEGTSQIVANLKSWIVEHGGLVHPDVVFESVESGFKIVAGNDIPTDATIVSIPSALSITSTVSKSALRALLNSQADGLSERQLACTYICMHWVAGPSDVLQHLPYLATLPSSDKLRTPLHFTEAELEAFKGSNLYGATLDRKREWQTEWEECRAIVAASNVKWGEDFTWERYLTAATYLSSRAFPSMLLSPEPSLVATPDSYPVLLPGIDALNHARAHPVSWVVSKSSDSSPDALLLSLVIRTPTPRGGELLNNYGPKPNAELILGYGFALPHNPEDTIVLKLGGGPGSPDEQARSEVGRAGRGAEAVWEILYAQLREMIEADDDPADEWGVEDVMEVTDMSCAVGILIDITQSLYEGLPPFPPPPERAREMRPEVLQMLEYYVEGQRDIVEGLLAFARAKKAEITRRERELGMYLSDEEE
ncbi:SET domain-containing protein [Epithele typhae]|uniref:SET domain-containing protein n=1 Tax=Epithele typhae TaxID=378194 RepID=UPI002007B406|nr:SET domain-containing protein [Epithele typhae]KAH9916275.1 SET domain-containing protein [Epithele typhae]